MSLKQSPTLRYSRLRIGLTIGDPSGIGPAITLLAVRRMKSTFDLTVIGDGFVLAEAAKLLGIGMPGIKLIETGAISRRGFSFGRVRGEYGKASLSYLDKALELLSKKEIDCLVTSPVSKEAINKAGYVFPGHTDYFSRRTSSPDAVMMLLNDRFKFSLLTRHIPLNKVSAEISAEKISRNIMVSIGGLRKYFLIKRPRLGVCALNPHASDNGLFGKEENEVIGPAVRKLQKKLRGAYLQGPLPADTAIYRQAKGEFDCLLAVYHDQALIPLKLAGSGSGVNLTLGLPFVRTSPLHGTAFDIAGCPLSADPGSLISAIKVAAQCALNQRRA